MPREAGHEDSGDAQLLRDRHGVHRPGASESEQGEVPWVEAAMHRYLAHRACHLRHRDPERRTREPRHVLAAAGSRTERSPGRPRLLRVQHEASGERTSDWQAAEDKVRVGDRRLGPPASVARGPRNRAGAMRPHAEGSIGLNPHDGPTAGADGVDVELGHLQWVGVDLVVVRHAGREPVHQSHVGARAAHVERDDVLHARTCRDPNRAGNPAHRPGEERPRATLRRRRERHRAPVRAHDVDRGRDVAFE